MLARILVPTDGSENAQRAERLGAEIAARFGAELLLAHAVVERPDPHELSEIGRVMQSIGPQSLAPLHMDNLVEMVSKATRAERVHSRGEAMRALGDHMLQRAEERAREAGAERIERHLLHGDAADAIVELARQQDVDLIVVGTRGIGGLRGRLLGSVSREVFQTAPQNTLVVRE
jgi:nucleotide-binding universal stress UspA family protein